MAWTAVTPADVATMTGAAFPDPDTDGILVRAVTFVELHAGRKVTAAGISTRDVERLRQAVAFQAVWMWKHPDVFAAAAPDRVAESISQPDLAITYADTAATSSGAVADAGALAPIAGSFLAKLSWRNRRSHRVKSLFQPADADQDSGDWVAI